MSSLNNKKSAIIITVMLIIISIFIIGGNQLITMQKNVNNIFKEGTQTRPLSIQSQINTIIGQANNMIVVSRRYLEEEQILPIIHALDNLNKATNPSDKYTYTNKLVLEISALHEKRDIINMSERDLSYFQGIVVNVESANRIIRNNDYNSIAEDFNKTLDRFPANIISAIRRINPSYIYG